MFGRVLNTPLMTLSKSKCVIKVNNKNSITTPMNEFEQILAW